MAVFSPDHDLGVLAQLLAASRPGEKRLLVDEIGDFAGGDGLKVEISANFLYISLDTGDLRGRLDIPLTLLFGKLGELEGDA
jgi:hypothetical protein